MHQHSHHRSHGHSQVLTALHALLSFSPTSQQNSRTLPPLIWDLKHPPATARPASDPRHHVSPRLFAQHATSPPTQFFRITSGLFPYSWHIDIQNPHGVTVGDVLEGIFKFLRRGVDKYEFANASRTQSARVAESFYARVQRSHDPRYEQSQGVRRIDWLLKHTMFVGLTPSLDAPHTWTLTMKRDA
ncbi:hypothetical protein BD410DRAFT_722311 [Rickenella mellea]|uniref:DUF6699 domain-containing protein n=1 Tax=Rickenella mellea TaxID=50990 RepID=A0A4Y7Q5W0_9AGAM|nr:hypothetical protein BD410DRAFT_722311 [Rickenella mellea]